MLLEIREAEDSVSIRTRYASYTVSEEGDDIFLEAAGLEETHSRLDFPDRANLVAIASFLVAYKESEEIGL